MTHELEGAPIEGVAVLVWSRFSARTSRTGSLPLRMALRKNGRSGIWPSSVPNSFDGGDQGHGRTVRVLRGRKEADLDVGAVLGPLDVAGELLQPLAASDVVLGHQVPVWCIVSHVTRRYSAILPRSIPYFASKRISPKVWTSVCADPAERDLVPVVFAAGADSPEMMPVDSDVARVTISPKRTVLRGDPAVVRAIHTGLVLAAELRAEGRPLQGR